MSLQVSGMLRHDRPTFRSIFLSASIPDPSRWDGEFDPLEITDAVIALARVAFTSKIRLITAAHPTIAPLLLYVAAEFPRNGGDLPFVTVYQSRLFEEVLPSATRRFQEEGVGELVWTEAVEGDTPEPGSREPSLELMRHTLFARANPSAAAFVGGMQGIADEFALFRDFFPARPIYAVGRPGGEARRLLGSVPDELRAILSTGDVYPAIWRAVVADLVKDS